jgi:quaternary ammonium compound-resistance protein SugE
MVGSSDGGTTRHVSFAAGTAPVLEAVMAWLVLFLAGLLEVVWAVGLKSGFTRLWPSLVTLTAMALSVLLLARAMQAIPMGTAYAVWTGIGAVGTVIAGIVLFGDPLTPTRTVCLLLILAGILGLKLHG